MKLERTLSWKLTLALAGVQMVQGQGPQIIAIGSPMTYGGANAPDTYTATTTFSSNRVVVNDGRVRIWQEQIPTGSNGEWDIFRMETVNGGPLANNPGAEWNIVISYTLTRAALFDGTFLQFAASGTPLGPVSNVGSICCATTSVPVLGGPGFSNPGGGGPIPAGLVSNWRQVFVTPYSFLASGGINIATANQFTFGLHFTVPQVRPSVTRVIGASAFGGFSSFGPSSWIEIYGSDLAVSPQTWSDNDFRGLNAPTALSGTSVSIGGQQAFIQYLSPGQINALVPNGVAAGSQQLIVTTPGGTSAPTAVTIEAVKPGLLAPASFRIGATQHVVALLADGTYVLPPGAIPGVASRRARPGETLVIYGVGFGSTSPAIPVGQIATTPNSLAAPFTISIGGTQATVSYGGLAPSFVGLYQFNVVVPAIAPNDAAPVVFSLGGASPGQTGLSLAVGN